MSRFDRFVGGARQRVKGRIRKNTIVFRVLKALEALWGGLVAAYRRLAGDGVFFRENEMWMCSLLPRKILDRVLELLAPRTVIDIGCGTGASLDYLLERGVVVTGVEGSKLAVSRARHPERIILHNLNRPLNLGKQFDLVWCFEVAEHIHPRHVEALIKTFSAHGDRIVMSAAQPGQGGEGHLNEQPPAYWIAKLQTAGYRFDEETTAQLRATGDLHSANLLVFVRSDA